jgi:phage anti-repressor protein
MIIMMPVKKSLVALYKSIKRFPITLVLTFSLALVLIVVSEITMNLGYDHSSIEILNRIAMVMALGIPLTLSIKLLFEKYASVNIVSKILVYVIASAFLGFYYSYLLKVIDTTSTSRYIALSFSLYLCFLFIPFYNKRELLELYVIKVFTRFFITIIYSAVLFLGLAAILFTVDKLLGIEVRSSIYYYTWLLTAGVFSSTFFLAGISENDESAEEFSYPKYLSILLLYIVMPLVSIYLAILYIYFAKIIITWKWPVGLVSHLVLWYSAFCVGLIFLIAPIKDNKWVKRFVLWFPKLILPILIMMFISMGIRINAYGITENRYYVVILGLWVLAMMLFISLKKERQNSVILVSLAIVSILTVFGPLSSFTVSRLSQNNRFTGILVKNGMLQEGAIIGKSDIPKDDINEISQILSYFDRNHSLQDVKHLPKDFSLNDMEKVFGFKYQESELYRPEKYISYNINERNDAIDISEYDYLFDLRMVKGQSETGNLRVQYNYENQDVKIFSADEVIYTLELSDFLKQLREKYPNSGNVNSEDMVYTDENQYVKAKFIFSYIGGMETREGEGIRIDGADFYVLLKKKK